MKKVALLMAMLMLVLSLAACGDETAKDPQIPNGPDVADTTAGTEETTGPSVEDCQHQYEQEIITEPNCTLNGSMQYLCTVCSHSYTEDVPAKGHDGSGASCVEPSTCADCGEVVEDPWGHEDEDGLCKHCGIDMAKVESAGNSGNTQAPEATEDAETTEATEATEAAG